MATKRTTGTSFDSLMSDLRARKFAPIYLLMGEEPYYIDQIADYIADHVLGETERDFNQTIVFGSDTTAAQVADMARRFPMMAEHQVVIVKEAQNLKNLEPLVAYAEKQPTNSTILVLCHKNSSLDRRKKTNSSLIAIVERIGVVFESKKKDERDLPTFIEAYLKKKGAEIDYKASQMMADHIGADLSRLSSELDKVLISLPENGEKKITPEIVEREIGVSKEFNRVELRAAIINRNVFKANQIVKYFDKNQKAGSVYSVLPLLFNYFQNLMLAYYAPNRSNENAVAQHLGLKSGWAAREYMTGMRNYSGMKTLQIISKMREIDAKSKGIENPNTDSGELMKELIFFILH